MKKLILAASIALLSLSSVTAHASDVESKSINVLRAGPVGAGLGLWSESVADTLRSNGYNVTVIGFNSCRESDKWIEENPDKPYAYLTYSDYGILREIKPDHPAACGQPLTEDTLVTIVGQWWNFICGKKGKNDSIEALVANRNAKVGVWNYPVSHTVARTHVKALGSEANVVGFASGKTMMTAFNTGDIDYIIMSSENLARSLPEASCFATSAPTAQAQEHMPGRVSYDQYEGVPFIGYGLWPIVAAGNVDIEKVREIFKTNPSESFTNLSSNFVPETRSIQEQIQGLEEITQQLKGLMD